MINRKLKEDWLALLKINKAINSSENPEDIQEIIKIPFTPLEVNVHLLYYLSQYLYPKFINDQKNVVDIIISDYDIDNIAFEGYLYNTSRLGIYDSVQSIPEGMISFKQEDLDNLEQLFINIQSTLLETKKVRIASVRFFRRKSIDLINRFYEKLDKYTMFEFLSNLLDLIQKLVKEKLIIIYPEPNILSFLKSLFLLFGDLKLSDIFKEIITILPFFNQTIIFHSKELNFLFNLQKLSSENQANLKLNLKKIDLEEHSLVSNLNKSDLSRLKKEFKSQNIKVFQFEPFIAYLLNVSELQAPFDKRKLKLLFQKILYAFTEKGIHWNIFPQPKIYNTIVRFLIRIFGFNINLKNLSYWALPDNLYNLIDVYLGLNYKIAFLLTNGEKPKYLISLSCQNGAPLKLTKINKENAIKNQKIESLSSLWNFINKKYGYHVLLFKIDIKMIQNLLDLFFFKFNKLNPFSLLSIMRKFKKSEYIDMFPELPPFKIMKKRNSLVLLKMILDNAIDRFEF